jgi:signal transduction histidine kinase
MNRVLIIEDEGALRETISEILAINGYEVIQAADGEEGIEKVLETLPDIIICDVNIPKMDGFAVLTILRSTLGEIQLPPFIFLTAKTDRKNIRQGMDLGAEDYITKPFNSEEILSAIKIRIEKRKRFQENILKNERERISDELHNGVQNIIVAAGMGIKSVLKSGGNISQQEIEVIQRSSELIDMALTETRSLSHNLVSDTLEKQGLKKYITEIIELLSASNKINFNYDFTFDEFKNKQLEFTICRIIQEMITNSLKHSNADRISLSVTRDGNTIVVMYSDNGVGFDFKNTIESEGLKGIRKKVENLKGILNINSSPGKGLAIDFTIKD